MSSHTKGPYRVSDANIIAVMAGTVMLCATRIHGNPTPDDLYECAENAAFIAKACNAHDDLVVVLDRIRRGVPVTAGFAADVLARHDLFPVSLSTEAA